MHKINLIWLASHFSIPSFSEKIVGLRRYRISMLKDFSKKNLHLNHNQTNAYSNIGNTELIFVDSNLLFIIFLGWFPSDDLFLVHLYSMENMVLSLSHNMSSNTRNNIIIFGYYTLCKCSFSKWRLRLEYC